MCQRVTLAFLKHLLPYITTGIFIISQRYTKGYTTVLNRLRQADIPLTYLKLDILGYLITVFRINNIKLVHYLHSYRYCYQPEKFPVSFRHLGIICLTLFKKHISLTGSVYKQYLRDPTIHLCGTSKSRHLPFEVLSSIAPKQDLIQDGAYPITQYEHFTRI